jgi:hypothetical protein
MGPKGLSFAIKDHSITGGREQIILKLAYLSGCGSG